MTDISALTDSLLANHITVRRRTSAAANGRSKTEDSRPLQSRVVAQLNLCAIHLGLGKVGYHRFLDHIDHNAQIHLFLADADAIPLIPDLVNGTVERGGSLDFDARAFVEDRLYELEELSVLDGEHDWWDIKAAKRRQRHAENVPAE